MNAPVLAAELKSSTAVPSPIPSNAGPSIRARIVERRTYLRPKDEDGKRFETPKEAKDRVIGHQRWLWENAVKRPLNEAEEAELAELRSLMDQAKISVSGRVKWMGGTDIIKERASAAFNCSFTILETPADFVDAFWLLLQGCGVGFKPKPGLLTGFPSTLLKVEVIPSTRTERGGAEDNSETVEDGVWTIKFGDSAKAWSKAIGKFLAEKHRVHTLRLDYSELRPGGKRLRGYGWLSSGWKPLADGFTKIADVMMRYADQPLDAVAILDIMNTLGTVLSSRRSAQIGLLEETHRDISAFVGAKTGEWYLTEAQRSQSNNSIMFTSKPSREKIVELLHQIYRTGEPGFVNLEAGRRRAPEMEGFNPCVTGETLVPIIGQGMRRIADLAGTDAIVRDAHGDHVRASFRKTGTNQPILAVTLSDGSIYNVTPTHEFVTMLGTKVAARELAPGAELRPASLGGDAVFGTKHAPEDAYVDAWVIADGTNVTGTNGSRLDLYPPKHKYAEALAEAGVMVAVEPDNHGRRSARLPGWPMHDKAHVPAYVLEGTRETVKAFIRGYVEADGHIGHTSKGWLVQITSIHRSLLQEMQALLRLFGVKSAISVMHAAGKRSLPDGKGGYKDYDCVDSFRLTVTNPAKFFETWYPENNKRGPYAVKETLSVVSVEETGRFEDVYCCGVPTTASFDLGTVHSGNCAEILLPSKGFCNLMQVVWHRYNGDFEGLKRAQYLAGRANYRQTVVSMRDGVLQLQWDDQQKLLRLCGVSPTGYVSWEYADSPSHLELVAEAARRGANDMADDLGLQRARRVTQCQPAGTSSKVLGLEGDEVHEGAHAAMSRYIFNNIQFNKLDPLVEKLRAANYTVFDHPSDPTGVIAAIPVEYPASPVFTKVVKNVPTAKLVVDPTSAAGEADVHDFLQRYRDDHVITKDEDAGGKTWTYKAWREEELEVNVESAVRQLERYRILMNHYIDHNCSITVSFDETEIEAMADWFMEHWDSYIGVSFLQRNDPTKSAIELGFQYLPQQAVSKRVYDAYVKTLLPVDLSDDAGEDMVLLDDCATGACPIR